MVIPVTTEVFVMDIAGSGSEFSVEIEARLPGCFFYLETWLAPTFEV